MRERIRTWPSTKSEEGPETDGSDAPPASPHPVPAVALGLPALPASALHSNGIPSVQPIPHLSGLTLSLPHTGGQAPLRHAESWYSVDEAAKGICILDRI